MRSKILSFLYLSGALLFFISCGSKRSDKQPREGIWRGVIQIEAGDVPFQIEFLEDSSRLVAYLINAEERLRLDDIVQDGDSIFIPMHIFNNEIRAKQFGDTLISGTLIKHIPNQVYELPILLEFGPDYRFMPTSYAAEFDFTGTWETSFFKPNGDSTQAIGIFSQKDRKLTGTFLTSSGDYRYLEGLVTGSTLLLSAFDGDHIFLFQASMGGDSVLNGQFWSGKSGYRTWRSVKNESASLPDPDTLTRIASPDSSFVISFPEYRGGTLNYPAPEYLGKVTIVQLLGTWCPNCMDETKFLVDWLKSEKYQDVAVIGLAFESSPEIEKASLRVAAMAKRMQVPYPIAIAGVPDSTASTKLPMISKIKAYPSTLILDKKGKIRHIHTGFSGPGTGIHFENFKSRFDQKIADLLKE